MEKVAVLHKCEKKNVEYTRKRAKVRERERESSRERIERACGAAVSAQVSVGMRGVCSSGELSLPSDVLGVTSPPDHTHTYTLCTTDADPEDLSPLSYTLPDTGHDRISGLGGCSARVFL